MGGWVGGMPGSILKFLTPSTILFHSTSTTAGSLVLTREFRDGKVSLQSSTLKIQGPESLTTQATDLLSTPWGGRGTANLQTPKRRSAVTDPTGSPYENQARERHSPSTRRDIPLFKATGTTTSPARTPRVWVRGPRS